MTEKVRIWFENGRYIDTENLIGDLLKLSGAMGISEIPDCDENVNNNSYMLGS